MPTLNQLLTFDSENEHVLEHDLLEKKNYSTPKIYDANGDLSKRWYVYFSFRNPNSGKLQRMKNIYGKSNNYKTKEDRLSVLTVYRKKLLQLLKQGYNPYADNSALYIKSNHTQAQFETIKIQHKKKVTSLVKEEPEMSFKEALNFGLKIKEKLVNNTTIRSYENKAKLFLE